MNRPILYYTILTFFISTLLVVWVYFSPSQQLVSSSFLYGVAFFITSAIMFIAFLVNAARRQSERRKYLLTLTALLINVMVAVGCVLIWNYALRTTNQNY